MSALALIAAIGCGDDGGTEPEGSISVSVSPTSLSVPQGGTGTVTATLTRGGGFAEAVNVTVEGLPTGVTASANPAQLTGAVTQAVVTVNVGSAVAPGNYTATIRASAAGIGAATTTYALTVTAAPVANYTLSATAASAVQGASGTSTVSIQRTNFTGGVTLTLDNPPTGITGTFSPNPATGDQSVLTINVASTVAPGTINLTVKGSATGPGDKTTTVALTVTAAPTANYALSVTPTTLPISAGGNGQATVNINRTNFTGAVTLSLDAPPAGITATFNASPTTANTSTATINVAANVQAGTYNLTIKGTATGIADKTTALTVTVSAAGSFTISGAAVSVAAGGSGTSTVTIVRTNFTTDINLSLLNPPTGITGTFTPSTLSGSTLTSTLQINVAGTVAAGPQTLTVQGVGGSVTQTGTVALTVTAASSVTLSISPTALSIQQGSSNSSATLNVTRTNFTGNVTPSVTSTLPAGMTVTFNPNPITGNSSQVTVNVGGSTPTGTHNLTITGAAGAAGNPTTTLAVTVTAATGGQNIVWDFCTADGPPMKFWSQSGGTWTEVTPTVVGQVTRFSFSIASATGGVAYTFQTSAAVLRNRASSSQFFGSNSKTKLSRDRLQTMQRLANQTLPQSTTFFDTFVRYGTATELSAFAAGGACTETAARVSKTLNVSGMGASEVGFLDYGPASAGLSPSTPSYTVEVPPGSYDWLASFGTPSGFPPSVTPSAYRIGRNEAAPGAAVSINRTGATAFSTVPYTISGASPGSFNTNIEFIQGSRGNVGFLTIATLSTASSGNMLFLAPADRLPTDLTGFSINNFVQASATDFEARSQIRWFGAPPASATFTLPPTVPAFTVTQPGGLWSAAGTIPTEYQTTVSPVTFNVNGGNGSATIQIDAMRGWLVANGMGTNYTIAQPTLPNFLAAWTPSAPFSAAGVFMSAFNELTVPTDGSVLNSAGRFIQP
jgi:hypothetical protein